MRIYTSIAIVVVCCLLGFALRLYQLDNVPLRGDEAFSVQRWTMTPLSQSLTEIAAIEPHPPLTYAIFRGWGLLFGQNSEFALRMLPVLANIIGIPALYALGKHLTKHPVVGYLAAFFWAIHPFQIWHAQDYRNYGIWGGLTVLTLWLGVRLIHANERNRLDWLLYTASALLTCMIFYNELITIGTLTLYVFATCWKDRAFLMRWTLLNSALIAVMFAIFWVLQDTLITSGGYTGTTGGLDPVQYWERFLPVLLFGETLSLSLLQQFNPFSVWWITIVVALFFSAIIVMVRGKHGKIFLLLLGIAPLIVLSVISTQLSIFRPRYIMQAAPAYTLLISYAAILMWKKHQPIYTRAVSMALVIFIIGLSILSLNNHYHDPAYSKAPAWDDLVAYLAENTQAEEVIIQTGVDASFGYYYETSTVPAPEFGLPADVDQPASEITSTMQTVADDYHSIWIVGQTFPDWQNAGVVEEWAFSNLQLVRETRIAGLPVRQFMRYDVLPTEIASVPLAIYAERIELVGMRILEPTPSNELPVWLYWRPTAQTGVSLTAFVHLVGAPNPETGSPLWSQDDHPPQNGRLSTDQWQPETTYRDIFVLPLEGVLAGTYSLYIGWYDPETGERLLLPDGSDAYQIDGIAIP